MSKFYRLFNDLFYFNQTNLSPLVMINLTNESDKNDKFVLKIMFCYWLTSIGLTLYFETYTLGIIGGAILNTLAWLSYKFFSGIHRRFLFCICLCLFSALFIQQQPGYVEPHFSFFPSIFILTLYNYVRLCLFLSVLPYYIILYLLTCRAIQ